MTREITATVDVEVANALENLSEQTGQPASYFISNALENYLEDAFDAAIAEQRLKDLRAGKSKVYDWQEVMERNGLSD